jgi:hypothetical protein
MNPDQYLLTIYLYIDPDSRIRTELFGFRLKGKFPLIVHLTGMFSNVSGDPCTPRSKEGKGVV